MLMPRLSGWHRTPHPEDAPWAASPALSKEFPSNHSPRVPSKSSPQQADVPHTSREATKWLREFLTEERVALDRLLQERHEALIVKLHANLGDAVLEHKAFEQQGAKQVAFEEAHSASDDGTDRSSEVHKNGNHFGDDTLTSVWTETAVQRVQWKASSLRTSPELRTSASFRNRLEAFVAGTTFELTFAGLIMLNAVAMALEAQYSGFDLGYDIGFAEYSQPASRVWPHLEFILGVSEQVFGVLFTIEVVVKILATRWVFLMSWWNWFDTAIIIFWLLGTSTGVGLDANPMLLRLVRLFRLMRLLRLVRTFHMFDVLHVMIKSLRASISVAVWSLALLFMIMMMGALVLNFIVAEKIRSGTVADEGVEEEMFTYFGSFSRGMLTMFELTLGNWVPVTRFLHEHVHETLGLLCLAYLCFVGFAFMRVITGVFLHETFKVASTDDELMIMQKNRQIEKHIEKMKRLFAEADDSGDGFLSHDEFLDVMSDPRVLSWLAAMELDVRDAELVFCLVDDGDNKISAEELVNGFARLKGSAKSLDLFTLLGMCNRIEERLMKLTCGYVQNDPFATNSLLSLRRNRKPTVVIPRRFSISSVG